MSSWTRSVAALLMPLALAACASVATMEVRTDRDAAAPLAVPAEEGAFQFVVYGDRTGGPVSGLEILEQAVEETNLLDPDLVMTVGDLVQGYNQTPLWLDQMRAYKAVMAGLAMPWFPVAGNHDIYWRGSTPPPGQHEGDYEAHFGPLWYWFPHKNAAFVVLFTDEGDRATNRKGYGSADLTRMSEEQIAWLAQTLRETAAYDHVFVFMHHPRWLKGYPEGGNWDLVHRLLAAAGNVSAVFAGHIHRQRYDGLRDGIVYYILATVGGRMPMDAPGSGWLNHFDAVTVRSDGFEIATLPVGTVIDPKTMTPERLADINRVRGMPILLLTERLDIDADGAARGEVRFRVENTARRPVEVTAELASPAPDWFVRPNHALVQLAPAEIREFDFELVRPSGLGGEISIPQFVLRTDYLAEDRRVDLAPRHLLAPLSPVIAATDGAAPSHDRVMVFDGDGDALWFAADAIPLDAPPLTLEAWVRPASAEGHQSVIGNVHDTGISLLLSGGRPRLLFRLDSGWVDVAAPAHEVLEIGRWRHLAGVLDGAEARLYVDGRLVARAEAAGPLAANDLPLHVGANPSDTGGSGDYFDGALDEVRVSMDARYTGEHFRPAARHEADAATALLLRFDRADMPFAFDASAGGRHGLPRGDAHWGAR
ncbi:MAG: hypothetical protein GY791_04445 [Alphaproteobacteria bacterium]|nr:hypothetical protein [Alphaproteobacteria bacterium]